MKLSTLAIAIAIGGLSASGAALAAKGGNNNGADDAVDSTYMTVLDEPSGSGNTIDQYCGDPSGNQSAVLKITQTGTTSNVTIDVEDAVPSTHFTVWMRIKGGSGFNDAGSPWTGGGATPLCSGTEFSTLNANSPWNNAAGSPAELCNSFTTDGYGDGSFSTTVNFPVVGGAYPFQQANGAPARPGHDAHADVPTAIVDPRTGNGGPFMIRVVSHCLDNANHGLSPATREAWFQFP